MIDIQGRSQELLELLANCIYERENPPEQPFFFNMTELQLVKIWLTAFKRECIDEMVK